ncbi:MAG: hypothetical protein HFH09_04740 [Bacilli bacterium]|jgi:hypothetical protein|nr:hypothetical protein [Bacilli bacterium]
MIGLMNYNISRTETGRSQLASIQIAYLNSLAGKNLTLEQIEQIERMLITNPNMMDNPTMYLGLERVQAELELLKNSVLTNSSTIAENYTR